jgi:predicted dehydrogenase
LVPHRENNMAQPPLRVGLIGAGANTRLRHIPGFRVVEGVELVAVCNRRPESTREVAREYGIPRTYEHWEDVVADPDIDAVVIGTWPYLHYTITLAALESGKHVLTEARLAMNADQAHEMLDAARARLELVTQVVPSPYGLKGHDVMRGAIDTGFLGELREVQVVGLNAGLADPVSPLSWRQDAALSGYNMLTLGIVHETLLRWAPPPVSVLAQTHAFIPTRTDPESGVQRYVGTPDSVQVLTILANGARASYHFSGVTRFGQQMGITLLGTEGALHYDLLSDRIYGTRAGAETPAARREEMAEIVIPKDKARAWRVEADFVDSIRHKTAVQLTSFETGVKYMEFTEAVAVSAQSGERVLLPLERE